MDLKSGMTLIGIFTSARIILNLVEDRDKIAAMSEAYMIKGDVHVDVEPEEVYE